jgi:hypothetical protein
MFAETFLITLPRSHGARQGKGRLFVCNTLVGWNSNASN